MGDDISTIDRMSGAPPKPAPLPKIPAEGDEKPVPRYADDNALADVAKMTGADLAGQVKVCGPALTEDQRRAQHRTELLKHVRSAILKRMDRDDQGRLQYHHDGDVRTSTDAARAYAWVDATEYHRAAPDLQGNAKTELGALRALMNKSGDSISGNEVRRPSPGGGIGVIAPIDSMAIRHVLRRSKHQWVRRLGLVGSGAAIAVAVLLGVMWVAAKANEPIRAARHAAPAVAERHAGDDGDQGSPPVGPLPHRTTAEWQAATQNAAEDPQPDVDAGQPAGRVIRRRRR